MSNELTLNINGETYAFTIGRRLGQIPETETLLETLRERIGLTGTKASCGQGACGCCAVLMEGKAVASCITLTAECLSLIHIYCVSPKLAIFAIIC